MFDLHSCVKPRLTVEKGNWAAGPSETWRGSWNSRKFWRACMDTYPLRSFTRLDIFTFLKLENLHNCWGLKTEADVYKPRLCPCNAPYILVSCRGNSILYITDKDRSLGKITITSLITFSNPLYLSLLLSATFKKCLLLFTKWNFKYYCWEIRRYLFSFSRLLLQRRIFNLSSM